MSVDERLLAAQTNNRAESGPEKGGPKAGNLREQQRGEQLPEEEESFDLRRQTMMARRRQKKQDKKGEEKSLSFPKSQILKENIYNLVTIFGATFFYVVWHWLMSKLGDKKKYAPLGSEWLDVPGLTVKQRDEIGSNFAPWENCCFVSASLGCLIAIILSLLPIMLLGYVIADPKNLLQLPSLLWDLLKEIVS